MPIYFSEVAPTCPISTDGSTGPREAHLFNRKIFNRATIPTAYDLRSAILVANLARTIVTSTTKDTVRNNVKQAKGGGQVNIQPDKFKNKAARWVEQKDKRVKKKYKYFGKDDDGNENILTWVTVERIERMVWYDKAWKSYLIWEGERQGGDPVIAGGLTAKEIAAKES